MKPIRSAIRWSLVLVLLLPAVTVAQETGSLAGRVVKEDGSAVGGVSVIVNETGQATVADSQGRYRFNNVRAGTYTITYTLGDQVDVEENVTVTAGETTDAEHTVNWDFTFAETLVVVSASRRAERIVDAPAAVSIITQAEIERDAATGQLPKLLEFASGAEITQGDLYDFNVNTRGFNSSLTRRVAVIVDGRDPSTPFLNSQEWGAASLPLDDIESLEMVRGPSAALYGANASSGVLNMLTRAPKGSQGGLLRLTGGELDTSNADFRYAAGLGGDWYFKGLGSYRHGDTFVRSRIGQAEYSRPCGPGVAVDCLPQETFPLQGTKVEGWAGSLRLDKYVGDSLALTFEGGSAAVEGIVFQTNVGRVQVEEVDRPWYRFNLNHPNFNVLVSRTERDAPFEPALGSGLNLVLDSTRNQAEIQGNWELSNKTRLVVGAAYKEQEVDTFDYRDRLVHTLLFNVVKADETGAFGQFDWEMNDQLKLVLAGRWDDSDTFYDNEFSPKIALVYGPNPNNTLRFTYNEGFQSPAIFELFLQVDAALPLQLQGFEAFCSPFGVNCGFNNPIGTRILGVGNANLGIEQIEAFEVGYSGILANKAFLTVDYYNTTDEDFISDLISTQFTPLGDYNTVFGPYAPPAGLPDGGAALMAALQGALGPSFALLSNNFDGIPILAAASYASFGVVDTQGVDIGLNYYLSSTWTVAANYSWFDFDIKQQVPGLENFLSPNSPEHAARASVTYVDKKVDFSLSGRWVDDFFWATGPFTSTVESYTTFDIGAGYNLNDSIKLSVNISNVFDNEHYEAFGGSLIGRRALGSIGFRW